MTEEETNQELYEKQQRLINDGWIPPWERPLYWYIGMSSENDKVDYIEMYTTGGQKVKMIPEAKIAEAKAEAYREVSETIKKIDDGLGFVDTETTNRSFRKIIRGLAERLLKGELPE